MSDKLTLIFATSLSPDCNFFERHSCGQTLIAEVGAVRFQPRS